MSSTAAHAPAPRRRTTPAPGPMLALGTVLLVLASRLAGPAPPAGWLGVTLNDARLPAVGGARLGKILDDSPAATIGLLAGDVVLDAGGRRIRAARDLSATVRRRHPGTALRLTVRRRDDIVTLTAVLASRPNDLPLRLERDRDPWQEPDRVLAALALRPGTAVADVGAGTGYFTERLAARVGSAGRVVAVDVDPDAVRALALRFPAARFPQVTVEQGTAIDPRLAPGSLDAALLVDTFHELEHPDLILGAVRRALVPGGILVIVDRPAAEAVPGAHAIPEAVVRAQAAAAGFALRAREDLPRQFLLVLAPTPAADVP